jgi:hypothetical protein
MNNSVFTTRDIVKYFIIAGIVYTILKLIPSSKLMEKDLILLLSIITVGFVCLDCMFKTNTKEKFMDNNDLLQYAKKANANVVVGDNTFNSSTNVNSNVAIGNNLGYSFLTGDNNILIGSGALDSVSSGNKNIIKLKLNIISNNLFKYFWYINHRCLFLIF